MKKILLIIFIVFSLLLVSCRYPETYSFLNSTDEIKKITIVQLSFDNEGSLIETEIQKIEDINTFLEDFKKISCYKYFGDPTSAATVGGAVYGGVLAATGNVWAAGFASAAAESLTNEVVSYIPKVSQANGQTVTKKVTTGNVIDSTKTVLNDTAVNGTISAVTGKIAGKIVPTNNGWFKPQKFVSSFAGKYAIKSELQTLTQSGLLFGVEGLKYSFNQRLKQGQQPIVTFFPDTEIRAAG